jgi:tetratricopeptide (TPR) repeat protein
MDAKIKTNLDTLLAISSPTEYEYEEIAKCYQRLGDYDQAIIYLEKAFKVLSSLFPDGFTIQDPYESRRRLCEDQLKQLEKSGKA